jgi:hypothetical protein
MKRFQWKWIFTGSKTCYTIWRPFWFAMVAIFNQKWPPKYKDPPIWEKFVFQIDYDVPNWYPSLVYYGGHFESKMAAKIQKSSDNDEIWLPSRLWCCELISIFGLLWWPFWIQNGTKIQKSSDLEEIWFPSRLWCCELISIVGLLFWPFCQWSPISMKIDI